MELVTGYANAQANKLNGIRNIWTNTFGVEQFGFLLRGQLNDLIRTIFACGEDNNNSLAYNYDYKPSFERQFRSLFVALFVQVF